MTKISSAPVTKQPAIHDIYNTFSVMGNEEVLFESTAERRRCGCLDISYTTLTDARVLLRMERQPCYCCCSRRNANDYTIFLRDIAQIRLTKELRENCDCCRCCIRRCHSPEVLEIRGTFGSKILRIPEQDLLNFQYELPIRVGNHKLISHH